MLQNIRNNIQGTMAKVVIAIIIVPFAFFGIDSLFGSGGPSPVARVNGQAITEVELNNAISLQQRQILAMMDGRADPELLDQSRLREPVLQRIIREQAVEDHARRIGMVVSEQSVNENIVALPQFRENGRFSVDRYRNLLRAQGLNPGTFKEELRSELLRLQLQQGIVASSLQLDRELADVARLLEQSRSFSYSIIDVAALAAEMEPDEEQLRAFHRSHGERFERPEQVRLSYIDLRADHLLEPVDEEELAAELARLEASAEQDTLRHAAHILIEVTDSEEAALEQAEALREQLDQGADFADLAQRHSADPGSRQQGGELGASSGDLFPEPFERALAELEPGEVSAPVRTESGYHLIRLLAVEEGEGFDQDERLAEVREQLQRQAAEHRLIALVETLRDLSFNAEGLQRPARELDLALQHSDWVALEGGEGLWADPRLQAALRSRDVLVEGHNSEVIELAPDHFVVVHVDEHRPAEQLPFEEVRDEVESAARQELASRRAAELAETLLAALDQGAELAELAPERGLAWQRAQQVQRADPTVQTEVLEHAFALPRPAEGGTTAVQRQLAGGDVLVLALSEVRAGDLESMEPGQQQALRQQLAANSGQLAMAAYLDRILDEAKIERM